MIAKLSKKTIQQIKTSKGRIVDIAARLGVSVASVSRYRPTKRKHLTEAEHDQIISEWISGVRTTDTASRLGVTIQTVQHARRRAMVALCKEKQNGTA